MLPENSLKQLLRLRKETKGKDIGDLTAHIGEIDLPNSTYIGNSVDKKVDSYEEFAAKDSKLQTIAFKSKLCNRPLVKENKIETMKNKVNNVLSISEFEKNWKPEEAKKTKRTEVAKDIIKENKYNGDWEKIDDLTWKCNVCGKEVDEDEFFGGLDILCSCDKIKKNENNFDLQFIEKKQKARNVEINKYDEFDDEDNFYNGPDVLPENKKNENSDPKFELLGKEKEEKGGFPYGYAQERDMQIKKINQFNLIDPKTPKERPVLNAGQFIDNDIVKGHINRIEGKDVYVESFENPMVIKKFSLKDAVKIKK